MAKGKTKKKRTLDARPDTLDFRDKMYTPTLFEVPIRIDLEEYKDWKVPILNQGQEGACTGFGLATVANYLLRRRKVVPDRISVSPRMLYEMARRYDEWPGEDYEGSSARGAMKGWHKHGVCSDEIWPYSTAKKDLKLTTERANDAIKRPMGAYYRVNHKDIVAMHTAMAEVGVLYATAIVHTGWENINNKGNIPFPGEALGGHAFALVAYNEHGFWIQNSWGKNWGLGGFALISYDDWLCNGTDVWVARLGAPVILTTYESTAISRSAAAGKSEAYSTADLRPHIISIGNDGRLDDSGTFGTSREEVASILTDDFKRITAGWSTKRLLLYAHGGLVDEVSAVQRLADYRTALLDSEVYPLTFIWHTDYWTTLTNMLNDAMRRRRPEGFLDAAKDFMLDRLDEALEPIARHFTGKAQWDEMKENARLATEATDGGARIALQYIARLVEEVPDLELHIIGHSAGSIFHAPIVRLLTSKGKISSGYLKGKSGYGIKVSTCTLWAPAITVDLFKQAYLPAIKNGSVERFALFTLTDEFEQDDNCASIYNKSLLYLVSDAFEEKPRIPLFRDGEPILGMEKFIRKDEDLKNLFSSKTADWVRAPNTETEGSINASTAKHHGDFDDDKTTVLAALARMLNQKKKAASLMINRNEPSLRAKRTQIASQTRL